MKFTNLIFKDYGALLDKALEQARTSSSLSKEAFAKFLKENNEIFKIYDEKISDYLLQRISVSYLEEWGQTSGKNQKKILTKHKKIFLDYFIYIHIAFKVYRNLIKSVNLEEWQVRDQVIIVMYGNICRMADEIGVVLGRVDIQFKIYELCFKRVCEDTSYARISG